MVHFILENTDILVHTSSIVPALIGAAGTLIGGLLGNKSQKEANKANAQQNEMMMRFNREEAEKTRKFNADEAQKQRDYETKMSNTEMSRRVADLRASGFNPALMGANPAGASTPSGAAASASSASSGSLTPMQPVNSLADSIVQSSLQASQVEVNRAQADNLRASAEKTEKETSWLDQMNGSQLEINESTIRLNGSTETLNEEKKKQLDQLIKESESVVKLNEEKVNEIKQNVASMSVHSQVEVLTYLLNSREVEAKIKELASRAYLNYENARDLVATRASRILGLQMSAYSSLKQGELYDSEAGKIKIDNLNGQLDFDIRNANKDWETFRYRAESIIQPLGDAVGTITQLWDIKRAFTGQHESTRHNKAIERETERHNRAEESRHNYETGYRSDENNRRQEKHDAWKAKKNRKNHNNMMDRFTYTR